MSSDHTHGHSAHDAPPNPYLEKHASPEQTAALEQRVRALESLLVAKGLVSSETLDKLVETYENRPRANQWGQGRCPRLGRSGV